MGYMNMLKSGNVCLFPFWTQLSPHGTIQLSPGKIHAHIQNGHKRVWNTFLDDVYVTELLFMEFLYFQNSAMVISLSF